MPTTATHTLEGPDLEALLARVPTELGPDATIVAANKLRSGGLGGFFTKEVFEVVVEVPAPGPEAVAPTAPRMSTEAIGFAGILDRMVRDAGVGGHRPPPHRARVRSPRLQAVAEPPAPAPEAAVDPLLDDPSELPFEPLVPARVPRPSAVVAAAPTPLPTTPPAPISPITPALDQRWLARVGVPANLAAHLTTVSHDPAVELFHLMDQLARPEALPQGPGSVIAVVGRRGDALEVAEAFALESSGRTPMTSSWRRRRSAARASRPSGAWRAPTWRWSGGGPGGDDASPPSSPSRRPSGRPRSAWATHLLDAVEPTMVWGVVEASRKAEDIRDWAERLGGLDALAVTNLSDTVSPAVGPRRGCARRPARRPRGHGQALDRHPQRAPGAGGMSAQPSLRPTPVTAHRPARPLCRRRSSCRSCSGRRSAWPPAERPRRRRKPACATWWPSSDADCRRGHRPPRRRPIEPSRTPTPPPSWPRSTPHASAAGPTTPPEHPGDRQGRNDAAVGCRRRALRSGCDFCGP